VQDDHRRHGLQPGTILVRESDGKPQRVMVLDQGFAWNGTTYRRCLCRQQASAAMEARATMITMLIVFTIGGQNFERHEQNAESRNLLAACAGAHERTARRSF
jgi:hypothetical protein